MGPNKILGSEINFVSEKKFCGWKNFGSENNVRSNKHISSSVSCAGVFGNTRLSLISYQFHHLWSYHFWLHIWLYHLWLYILPIHLWLHNNIVHEFIFDYTIHVIAYLITSFVIWIQIELFVTAYLITSFVIAFISNHHCGLYIWFYHSRLFWNWFKFHFCLGWNLF